jgi:hypothetical protein
MLTSKEVLRNMPGLPLAAQRAALTNHSWSGFLTYNPRIDFDIWKVLWERRKHLSYNADYLLCSRKFGPGDLPTVLKATMRLMLLDSVLHHNHLTKKQRQLLVGKKPVLKVQRHLVSHYQADEAFQYQMLDSYYSLTALKVAANLPPKMLSTTKVYDLITRAIAENASDEEWGRTVSYANLSRLMDSHPGVIDQFLAQSVCHNRLRTRIAMSPHLRTVSQQALTLGLDPVTLTPRTSGEPVSSTVITEVNRNPRTHPEILAATQLHLKSPNSSSLWLTTLGPNERPHSLGTITGDYSSLTGSELNRVVEFCLGATSGSGYERWPASLLVELTHNPALPREPNVLRDQWTNFDLLAYRTATAQRARLTQPNKVWPALRCPHNKTPQKSRPFPPKAASALRAGLGDNQHAWELFFTLSENPSAKNDSLASLIKIARQLSGAK